MSEDGIPCPTWIPTLPKHQGLAVGRHNHGPYIMQSSSNKHVWRLDCLKVVNDTYHLSSIIHA